MENKLMEMPDMLWTAPPKVYGYVRISTDKQNVDNQKYEILKFADEKKVRVDQWIEEIVSGSKKIADRRLGVLLRNMKQHDVLIISELSRLGRSLMEVMSVLHDCMERDIRVFTTKERYELGNNVNSKVLAFAFGLAAEIERNMISQRTREALSRLKDKGVRLGRPKGKLSKTVKLTGREKEIEGLLAKRVSISAIGRLMGVNRVTVYNFIKRQKLKA